MAEAYPLMNELAANPVVATQVGRFVGEPTATGVDLTWSTPVGGTSTQVNLYRSVGDVPPLMATTPAA